MVRNEDVLPNASIGDMDFLTRDIVRATSGAGKQYPECICADLWT
jgi:hypothetical protein